MPILSFLETESENTALLLQTATATQRVQFRQASEQFRHMSVNRNLCSGEIFNYESDENREKAMGLTVATEWPEASEYSSAPFLKIL